ncbi:hypothetical protein [Congregibacter sp.]|uniref:hypothetical protein n=1 Tax=Congregibacter sp. TaxID=2744308 RepID=UPI003F6D31CF
MMKSLKLSTAIGYSLAAIAASALLSTANASLDAKFWPASDKAAQFVKDTVVIGMLASPYGIGWT